MEKSVNDELKCPHCLGLVPRGARVCRGCNAEIKYGTPSFVLILLIGLSVFLGYKTSSLVSDSFSFLGWVVGILAFFIGGAIAHGKFENRVVFERIYRT